MKKVLLATASLVMLAGSAMAADMPVYKAAPVAAAPACAQFGGFYIGGNVGWKYYDHKWQNKDGYIGAVYSFDSGEASDNGFTAGVQAGYNFQWHCAVWGIQGDWNWTNVEADNNYSNLIAYELAVKSKEKWYGTLRTRSGVVIDNLLLYVTGGFAWAKFDRELAYTVGGTPLDAWSSSKTKLGFAVGAGAEWALNQNWSITSEFLYMAFEKDSPNFGSVYFPAASNRYEFKDSEWVAKWGLNYRFGGAAPVVARY